MALLDAEYAVVWPEVVAKLGDFDTLGLRERFDQHVLHLAKKRLLDQGLIRELSGGTRGGRNITILAPVDDRLRRAKIKAAAGRKRLLQARYQMWASGSPAVEGVLGPAGERVLHATLKDVASEAGFRFVRPEGGHVAHLYGQQVPVGPIDNVAHLPLFDPDGVPTGTVASVLFEVKNIREWIYSRSDSVYQLLDKAARLQRAHPARAFLPVLVCRRAHITAFRLARDFGFQIIQLRSQFLLPLASVPEEDVVEVRAELGYIDLRRHDGVHDGLRKHLHPGLAKVAQTRIERWAQIAQSPIAYLLELLRPSDLEDGVRSTRLQGLRINAASVLGADMRGGW
jgi:hypothetical protein